MVRICLSGAAHRRASPLLVAAVALASLTIAASFSFPPSLPAASHSLASRSLRAPRRAAVLAGRTPQRSFLCMKDKDSKEGGDSAEELKVSPTPCPTGPRRPATPPAQSPAARARRLSRLRGQARLDKLTEQAESYKGSDVEDLADGLQVSSLPCVRFDPTRASSPPRVCLFWSDPTRPGRILGLAVGAARRPLA